MKCSHCHQERHCFLTVRWGWVYASCLGKLGYEPADLTPSQQFPDEYEVAAGVCSWRGD